VCVCVCVCECVCVSVCVCVCVGGCFDPSHPENNINAFEGVCSKSELLKKDQKKFHMDEMRGKKDPVERS
jgi:hypothetical protein